jgi:hypothetical protein
MSGMSSPMAAWTSEAWLNMAKLSPQLSTDVSKTSALEIQSPSITLGIGMRI